MESSAEGRPQSARRETGASLSRTRGLAWAGGVIVSLAASVVAAALAVALAATVVVVAVMGGALLALAGLALRARRRVTARASDGPQILEARHIGGHSWVAYGWDQPR